jgi:hypothetical protein
MAFSLGTLGVDLEICGFLKFIRAGDSLDMSWALAMATSENHDNIKINRALWSICFDNIKMRW